MSCVEDENASFSRDDTSDTHMRFHTRRHLFVCPRLVYLWCARDLQRDHLAETMAEMTCEFEVVAVMFAKVSDMLE